MGVPATASGPSVRTAISHISDEAGPGAFRNDLAQRVDYQLAAICLRFSAKR